MNTRQRRIKKVLQGIHPDIIRVFIEDDETPAIELLSRGDEPDNIMTYREFEAGTITYELLLGFLDASKEPPTILDIAISRGAKEDEKGAINGSEFNRVGLPLMGGCCICNATIAAYNAYPGRCGYLIGSCCMQPEDVYTTIEEFEEEYGKPEDA